MPALRLAACNAIGLQHKPSNISLAPHPQGQLFCPGKRTDLAGARAKDLLEGLGGNTIALADAQESTECWSK